MQILFLKKNWCGNRTPYPLLIYMWKLFLIVTSALPLIIHIVIFAFAKNLISLQFLRPVLSILQGLIMIFTIAFYFYDKKTKSISKVISNFAFYIFIVILVYSFIILEVIKNLFS